MAHEAYSSAITFFDFGAKLASGSELKTPRCLSTRVTWHWAGDVAAQCSLRTGTSIYLPMSRQWSLLASVISTASLSVLQPQQRGSRTRPIIIDARVAEFSHLADGVAFFFGTVMWWTGIRIIVMVVVVGSFLLAGRCCLPRVQGMGSRLGS